MSNELDLDSAINALDTYQYDQKHSADLEQARNKQQMSKYLNSLDYSLHRLRVLQETVNELVAAKEAEQVRQEHVQTYQTKIINLAKEYDTNYQEVILVMKQLELKASS
ncbi:hypothetical protein [Shewanella gelidii]|uniref:Uncharacterized protein n=1 Tax=Shewanella gelidii TaxID=1642821 RepID=A0A917JV76_9GAMM|nr:hypothetical protein [Shewanella gelidii]MCL1098614.1 hypothetical protein [Shewanella gelidii]GGI86607.1 hypothetical protein GCM10009332_24970 [Shewanella gelidii]